MKWERKERAFGISYGILHQLLEVDLIRKNGSGFEKNVIVIFYI